MCTPEILFLRLGESVNLRKNSVPHDIAHGKIRAVKYSLYLPIGLVPDMVQKLHRPWVDRFIWTKLKIVYVSYVIGVLN